LHFIYIRGIYSKNKINRGGGGAVAQIMYIHVSKCKNEKLKCLKKKKKTCKHTSILLFPGARAVASCAGEVQLVRRRTGCYTQGGELELGGFNSTKNRRPSAVEVRRHFPVWTILLGA
jgi:hypothetical protein